MSKHQTIYQVDAFTNKVFKGNPAAVMVVNNMPSEAYMQNIAMEMNLSETAFIEPKNDIFNIRFFTPKAEIPVAGHPTLASAHILYELDMVPPTDGITFMAKGGTLKVKKDEDFIVMNFPKFQYQKIENVKAFEHVIGFEPVSMYQSDYHWKIAVAKDVEDISNAKPKFDQMTKLGLGHLIITAESANSDEDFVVRCFAPELGVNEDPVTGSAHCALTPLWAEKLGKTSMRSKQLSNRTGQLLARLIDDRVEIKGKAITVFEANLK